MFPRHPSKAAISAPTISPSLLVDEQRTGCEPLERLERVRGLGVPAPRLVPERENGVGNRRVWHFVALP